MCNVEILIHSNKMSLQAFGKDKFLENLRRISEQTSKKEAEVEAKMKAERQQTSKKKAEVEAKMKAKREEGLFDFR